MARPAGCGWWVLRWCRSDDEVVVANWIVTDCEFEQAVEDESAAARGAPVEAEHELVEIALQMSLVDGALMGAEQPALRKRGDPVHAWQQFGWVVATCSCGSLTAPVVDVAELVDLAVSLPAVGDQLRAGFDVIGDHPVK